MTDREKSEIELMKQKRQTYQTPGIITEKGLTTLSSPSSSSVEIIIINKSSSSCHKTMKTILYMFTRISAILIDH